MIITERPPNFADILKAFPDADKPGVIFAYGEHIFNPSNVAIPAALLAHETVHQLRQLRHRDPTGRPHAAEENVQAWWTHYLSDAEFRYQEELAAHVAEYLVQCRGLDRNFKAKLLQATASRLIAPLYNYVPPRSMSVAMRDIRWEIEK